jgi:hypothetical protein
VTQFHWLSGHFVFSSKYYRELHIETGRIFEVVVGLPPAQLFKVYFVDSLNFDEIHSASSPDFAGRKLRQWKEQERNGWSRTDSRLTGYRTTAFAGFAGGG